MMLETWMVVVLFIVFTVGMFHLWTLGLAQGYNDGVLDTIEKLVDAGLLDESKVKVMDEDGNPL